ncbi:endonuclease/exonuclease/phosphatase family protein [Kribbella sandramycini]|uniref:Endonuclease/exonuclease/phosphatase family protein n=1 Tax=Kribbella sandramycini TaxID=60450 RepID=A0A7Y4KW83_9ACTN|nr:endonuclease/exonuclease/phosphatase family protein [Kribbella sandramycini]
MIALGLLLGSITPASAAGTTYKVWSWNVSGWVMNKASISTGMVSGAVSSIQARDADFVVLTEVCRQQYKEIQRRLAATGWPQDSTNFSRFAAQRETVCNGQAFGEAIFSRLPLGTASSVLLPQDETVEQRKLLCAPLVARPKLRVCAVHVTPYSTNVAQLDKVLATLEQHNANGDTTLVAGDFNAQPSWARLDKYYDAALTTDHNGQNRGNYRELDDTDANCPGYGEATTENNTSGACNQAAKIDLIFVRKNHLAGPYSADSLAIAQSCAGPCSDHRILTATVTLDR